MNKNYLFKKYLKERGMQPEEDHEDNYDTENNFSFLPLFSLLSC